MTAEDYLSLPLKIMQRVEWLNNVEHILRKTGETDKANNLKADIDKMERERAMWLTRVEGRIARLPDDYERFALRLRFVEGLRNDEIAATMAYCERQVYRILRRGILHMEGILEGC
ncbi:MAG: hypothetical protein PHQ85_09635 [Eubacteriales bacterium]|jgi:DNA-directed RNA polymerase specialized sigma24 family protein|nr:hypothetical protein [Eubacteriales bacterium]MDD4105369.1 hypothetical protein [Eubacteriales bacterium]MDD4711246.1 hypothetical protein [Eubacteriales bacterium]NLO15962.1 hypothetical protein [Clostridiales bacterium]